MAAIRQEFLQWEQTRSEPKIALEDVGSEEANFTFSDGISFQVHFPPNYPGTTEQLLVFSEEDAGSISHLEPWLRHMMAFSGAVHSLTEILDEAERSYTRIQGECGEPASDSDGTEDSDTDEDMFRDDFAIEAQSSAAKKPRTEDEISADKFFTGSGSKAATERLLKDLKAIHHSDSKTLGYSAAPVDDNLYLWKVELFDFEKDSGLANDLIEYGNRVSRPGSVELEIKFASDYPFSPPFVRVVRPRFKFHTGHITIGGSICMELLTRSGWTPGNDIESVIIQIRSEIMSGGARLDLTRMDDYSEEQALDAFKRVARQHGWRA